MAEAAWEMIQEEMSSTLPCPFGPRLNEKELELRRKLELSAELLAGGDSRTIWERYEAERQRRIRSRGLRLRFFWEKEGGMECIRYVVEDEGGRTVAVGGRAPAVAAGQNSRGENEASDGVNAPGIALAAGQIGKENEADDPDAPAAASQTTREMQSAGAVVGDDYYAEDSFSL